ncbi:MAG: hypothetical protein JWM41_3053 [Gemmatimonadetes bacterium]|nr:hypothetical protein [Gemmatimonadota bacterium]
MNSYGFRVDQGTIPNRLFNSVQQLSVPAAGCLHAEGPPSHAGRSRSGYLNAAVSPADLPNAGFRCVIGSRVH